MKCLGDCGLVSLICQFCFDFNELGVHFLLEAGVVTLGRRSPTDLPKTLHLMESVFYLLFQSPHFFVDQFKLTVRHRASSVAGTITSERRPCTVKSHVSLHVLEGDFVLEASVLLVHGDTVLFDADFGLDVGRNLSHGALNVCKVGLCSKLGVHILLVSLRGQNLLHLLDTLALRLHHMAGCLER